MIMTDAKKWDFFGLIPMQGNSLASVLVTLSFAIELQREQAYSKLNIVTATSNYYYFI